MPKGTNIAAAGYQWFADYNTDSGACVQSCGNNWYADTTDMYCRADCHVAPNAAPNQRFKYEGTAGNTPKYCVDDCSAQFNQIYAVNILYRNHIDHTCVTRDLCDPSESNADDQFGDCWEFCPHSPVPSWTFDRKVDGIHDHYFCVPSCELEDILYYSAILGPVRSCVLPQDCAAH